MISPTQSFFGPVQVVQLYKKQIRFGKGEKGSFDLKAFLALTDSCLSSGFVENGKLFLPESIKDNKELYNADLLVIEDDLLGEKPSEFHFFRTSSANFIEIFKIRGCNPMELHLEWNYFYVGDPSRQNMKVCDLEPSKAYEIRINGKTDFSLTGRRPRHYLEQVFVVAHLGTFSECRLLSSSEKLPLKQLPEPRKLIDLRKPLW